MAKKKSFFWSNFWGETGRNSGKWASNKLFGISGWATPKRIILNSDDMRKKTSGDDFLEDEIQTESRQNVKQDRNYLYKKATDLKFENDDIKEICENIDELLLGAHQAIQDQISVNIFKVKIRSGINRLYRLGETDMADFYSSELKKLTGSVVLERIGRFVLIVIVFAGLVFFAFFYKSPFSLF
jgi:hypothetical protein